MKNVVYQILNTSSGKSYVGSTFDLNTRKQRHLHDLENGRHHNKPLQRAFYKHGRHALLFITLEFNIEKKDLAEREQFYIYKIEPEYNILRETYSMENRKMPDRYIKMMRERMKGNKRANGNTSARKVTKEIHDKVLRLRSEGLGCRRISKLVNLNKTTILNIFNKKFNYGYDC